MTVDWSKWHIFWVDERVVAKNHADSNYKLAKDGFLSKVNISTSALFCIDVFFVKRSLKYISFEKSFWDD